MEMVQKIVKRKLLARGKYNQAVPNDPYLEFTKIFDGKLLTPADEALFGSTSVCDILGPVCSKVQDAALTTILSVESGKGSTQYGFWRKIPSRRRRMAQREFSSRRDSPVMIRLLQQIVHANQKHNELN